MTGGQRPPRLAMWLVSAAAPRQDRDQLLGDLEERFTRRLQSSEIGRARRWYWGQGLGIVLLLTPRRIARSIPGIVAPGTARAALRSLLRSPWASFAAAVTLAVGIAAPSAMFGLADGTTSSLPGDPGDRVVRMSLVDRTGRSHMGMSWSLFEAWRQNATGPGQALSSLGAFRSPGKVAIGGGGVYAARYWGVYATAGLFRMLHVQPVVGRLYDGERDDGLRAMLIREDVWQERFDRDPGALGQVLRVEGVDHVVVGVLPQDFGFPVDHRVWMEPEWGEDPAWSIVGRLAPGSSSTVAREQLAAVLAATPWGAEGGDSPAVQVERYTQAHFGSEGDTARLVALISLILVIVTAVNVANIMLARGVSRSRETALRRAIGASRGHVMALTLTEVLFLALGGGVLGLLMGHVALQAMVRYLVSQATIIPYWMDFEMGTRSIILAFTLTVVALAVAGGVPALRSSKTDLDSALRLRPHGGPGGGGRVMTVIVGLEVTLACFLLSVSSGVIDEARSTLKTGAAFPTEGVRTGQLVLKAPDYPDGDTRRVLLRRLASALRADPSVRGVSLASALPGKDAVTGPVGLVGIDEDPDKAPLAQVRMVDASFFPMLDIRPSTGRLLAEADRATTGAIAVVNEAFVRNRGIEGEALGHRIAVAHASNGAAYTATVVGVVDDGGVTPYTRGRPSPGVYLALEQLPPRATYLMMRTREGSSLVQVWHRTVATLDPYLPLDNVMSLDEALRRGHGAATLYLFVFLGLGTAAFLVAIVGLYGVHSFLMARRVRDIGIRRALGAQDGRVLRESMFRGLRPVWFGLLLGVVPGFLAARSLVPIEPHVLTYSLAPILLVATSVFAIWGPTRRASRADPVDALRGG